MLQNLGISFYPDCSSIIDPLYFQGLFWRRWALPWDMITIKSCLPKGLWNSGETPTNLFCQVLFAVSESRLLVFIISSFIISSYIISHLTMLAIAVVSHKLWTHSKDTRQYGWALAWSSTISLPYIVCLKKVKQFLLTFLIILYPFGFTSVHNF